MLPLTSELADYLVEDYISDMNISIDMSTSPDPGRSFAKVLSDAVSYVVNESSKVLIN